jgi:hypothetical protein
MCRGRVRVAPRNRARRPRSIQLGRQVNRDHEGDGAGDDQGEGDAQAAVTEMQAMGMPAGSPVTLDSVEVYSVAATA